MIAAGSQRTCIAGFDDAFFRESFERDWRFVPFSGAWNPGSIISSSDFEYLAVVPPASARTNIRASRTKADGSVDEMPIEPGVTARTLAALFERGYTLICDEASAGRPAIYDVCEQLKDAARRYAPVAVRSHSTCGLFLTPRGAQGLALHHDSQHVFAVQLEGTKTWRLYAPRQANATANSSPNEYRDARPPLVAEITLGPGDALYVPRGFPHEVATSSATHSLHMSIGLTTLSWCDVLIPLLQGSDAIRASVPAAIGSNASILALREVLLAALTPETLAEQVQRVALADLMRASQHGYGMLSDAVRAQLVPPFARRFAEYRVLLFEGSTVVGFPGGLMTFPANWFDRVERFLRDDVIDEVAARAFFSPEDAALLVATLIEHGFVRSAHDR